MWFALSETAHSRGSCGEIKKTANNTFGSVMVPGVERGQVMSDPGMAGSSLLPHPRFGGDFSDGGDQGLVRNKTDPRLHPA